MGKKLNKVVFLVPKFDNDGKPFTNADMKWLEFELLLFFGGFTMEGETKGLWIGDDGKTYKDECLRISVAYESEKTEALEELLLAIKRRFRQHALYTERPLVKVHII